MLPCSTVLAPLTCCRCIDVAGAMAAPLPSEDCGMISDVLAMPAATANGTAARALTA